MVRRLHWSPDSANLVVRIALEVLGLDYEAVRVDRATGENRSPAYLERNPQGLLPVLEDDGLVLFETGAILWHLAERAGRLGPDGPEMAEGPARTAMLKWLFFVSNTLHADLRIAFYTDRYAPADAIAGVRGRIGRRVREHCELLAGEMARRGGGLVGPAPTLVDIYAACCLRWAQIYPADAPPLDGLGPWPGLMASARRIEALAGARFAFVAESIPPDAALSAARPVDLPPTSVVGRG